MHRVNGRICMAEFCCLFSGKKCKFADLVTPSGTVHLPGIKIIFKHFQGKSMLRQVIPAVLFQLIHKSCTSVNLYTQTTLLKIIVILIFCKFRNRLFRQRDKAAIKTINAHGLQGSMEGHALTPLQGNGAVLLFALGRKGIALCIVDIRHQKFLIPVLVPEHKFTLEITADRVRMRIVSDDGDSVRRSLGLTCGQCKESSGFHSG